MKKIALLLIISTFWHFSFAQLTIDNPKKSIETSFFLDTKGSEPEILVKSFLLSKLTTNKNTDFTLIRMEADVLGMHHYKYYQTYKGLCVDGSIIIVHCKNGYIQSANGEFFDIRENINTTSTISIGQANLLAQLALPSNNYSTNTDSTTLVILPIKNEEDYIYKLAYKTDIYSLEPIFSRKHIYIDALSGKKLTEYNRLCAADEAGTAQTKYSGTKSITTNKESNTKYTLNETGRGGGINTVNANNSNSVTNYTEFEDDDNNWNNINAAQDETATDVHWATEVTYDYFKNTFGRSSYDNNNKKMIAYAHFGENLSNAFWDGNRTLFGDGDGNTFTSLTALEIVAHEHTHGYTDFAANFISQGEPGALNESFSDIFGNTIEYYNKPNASWIIGEEITVDGKGIRSMSNPNDFLHPKTYKGQYWSNGSNLHGDGGVQNFWYYLLVNGGTGTNDNGENYTVKGIGIEKAAAIAFRNLTVYLTRNSSFADARKFSIQAARDLYGNCSNELEQTINAWHAVGVGKSFVNNNAPLALIGNIPAEYCTPSNVKFINNSTNANAFLWDFGDGSTSTDENPTHRYTTEGKYTVKLTVTNTCNGNTSTESKQDLIFLPNGKYCPIIMKKNGQLDTVVQNCNFDIYDSGFEDKYNSTSKLNLKFANADFVDLYFEEFKFANTSFDYLEIIEKNSERNFGKFKNEELKGRTIHIEGDSIYLFLSARGSDSGFKAHVTCGVAAQKPVADFKVSSLKTCLNTFAFTSTSTDNPVTYLWDFGDGTTSTLSNPTHTYLLLGVYNVKLKVCNSKGCSEKSLLLENNGSIENCEIILSNEYVFLRDICNLKILDNGGNNPYEVNDSGIFGNGHSAYVSNSNADFFELSFDTLNFNLDPFALDYLRIYASSNNKNYYVYGTELPNKGQPIIIVKNDELYSEPSFNIEEFANSENKTRKPGMVLDVKCGIVTGLPEADFTFKKSDCSNSYIFEATSTNYPHNYTWNISGEATVFEGNNLIYTFTTGGTYTITLIVKNKLGIDIVTKTIDIILTNNTLADNYCKAFSLNNMGEQYLESISINNQEINCVGDYINSYIDNTCNNPIKLTINSPNKLYLNPKYIGNYYANFWIDVNNDKIFTENEHIYNINMLSNKLLYNVNLPFSIPNGTELMMRIIFTSSPTSLPCDTIFGFSQIIDTKIVIDSTISTSISEEKEALINFKLFPNPTINTLNFNIAFKTNTSGILHIYNPLGQEVYSKNYFGTEIKDIIETSDLKQGIYYATFTTTNNIYSKRITKM